MEIIYNICIFNQRGLLIMKGWKDISEYNAIWKNIIKGAEYYDRTYEQRKNPKCEFDIEFSDYYKKSMDKLKKFQEKYIKEHPEEFDENGNFKEDTK